MKKKSSPVITLSREELIAKAENDWSLDSTPIGIIPTPTRYFEVGEQVKIGHLKEVFIEKVLFNGKRYVYRCLWTDRDNPDGVVQYRSAYWTSIEKIADTSNVPRLCSNYRQFPAINSDIESILHHMYAGGLVVDPRYQREYVWSEENKDALIESIFDHLDIGSFLFIRHHGYLHKTDDDVHNYRTLDGREVQIKASEDNTIAIIDGQQRLTTIHDFVFDRRSYKGIFFSQMNYRDQIEFMQKSVMSRIFNEEDVTEKEVLRMFLQSNRGVPQAPEHIAKVQAMYDAMKD